MKKVLIALCMLFLAFNVQAQETDAEKQARAMELMSKKVTMTVDSDLFMGVTPNTYVSESPKAVIMAMMVPESYATTKSKMNNEMNDKFTVTNKGEKTMQGVKVLFMEGTSNAEGSTLNNVIYCMEYDKDTCIMFIGMVEKGADKKYQTAINNSANSMIKAYKK